MRFDQLAGGAYLAGSTLAALNALNGYRPLARRGRGSVASFATGIGATEIPFSGIVLSVAETAASVAGGAHRTATGRAGLVLSAAAVAGLVGLQLRSRPAPSIVDAALREALGPDFPDAVAHPDWPGADAELGRQLGAVRMLRAHKRYAHDSDISYGPAGARNHLDVWRRPDLPAGSKAPVLVQVHGGAWVYGSKVGQAYPLLSHLVERGWVCVSLNYRLSPRATWPDQILDVKRAVAWVKQNIADYGGDPGFVAITGGSAGGHLTALHALTAQDSRWQPGFEEVDTTVAAAVPYYGVYDWTNRDGHVDDEVVDVLQEHVVKQPFEAARALFDEASPMSHVRADAPPFFCLHGTNDSLVPIGQARSFVRRLRAVSNAPVAFAEFPGAQHAFDIFSSNRANASAVAVEQFLGVVYGEHKRGHRVTARQHVSA
jgi:acetyl esterase/lipase